MNPRIENAINVFLDAINEGTLAKGDCTKCAVGNLVRVGCNYDPKFYNEAFLAKSLKYGYINWSMVFCTSSRYRKQSFKRKTYPKLLEEYPEVKKQFDSVDFTVEELAKIEKVFERNTKIHYIDYSNKTREEIRKDQIRGLEAVIQVMLGFEDSKEDVKEIFTKKADLIPV